jgi:hypothetical protein
MKNSIITVNCTRIVQLIQNFVFVSSGERQVSLYENLDFETKAVIDSGGYTSVFWRQS